MYRVLLLQSLLAFYCAFTPSLLKAQPDSTVLEHLRLDSAVASAYAAGFNGAILVSRGEQILLDAVVGQADLEAGRALTTADRFDLASVSKQFTAAAILQLIEAGKFTLVTPVAELLPGFPYPDITVEHLLRHQSGLPDYADDETFPFADSVEMVTNDVVLATLTTQRPPLDTVPGVVYAYCNTSYVLLASIVEAVTGEGFPDYLRNHLFTPAGMNATAIYRRRFRDSVLTPVAEGYTLDGETGERIDVDTYEETQDYYHFFDGVPGDGSINSTARDLHRWWRSLSTGVVLPREYFESMKTSDEVYPGYGLGLALMDFRGEALVAHAGGWAGFNNFVFYDPSTDSYFVILSNFEYDDATLGDLAGALLEATR